MSPDRASRRRYDGTTVGAPTNRHLDELTAMSLMEYSVDLSRQVVSQRDPSPGRCRALSRALQKAAAELGRRGGGI